MRQHYDHLVIGGGIAGVTAAETVRQRDGRATVCVLGAERHPLYSRVLLPHVADRRAEASRAVLKTPDALAAKGIEFVTGAEVRAIDARAKEAVLADARASRTARCSSPADRPRGVSADRAENTA